MRFIIGLLSILIFSQCVPFQEEILTDINLDIQDPILQKIHSFQDEQNVDSLYLYFRHKDPSYRYAAAMSFASTRDSSALDSLAVLLNDRIDLVRAGAAFSIGQIQSKKGELLLLSAFEQEDTVGAFKMSNSAILEAVGKCGDADKLDALATISTYDIGDTLLLKGQVHGIYRYALRGIASKKGTDKMVEFISDRKYPKEVRLIAAHYLMRTEDIKLQEHSEALVHAFTKEENAEIRMALARSIGKTKSVIAREALMGLFGAEQDYRVRCNMLSALGDYDYLLVKDFIFNALKDKNVHVSLTAANFLTQNGIPKEAKLYWRTARDTMPWQTQLELYKAAHTYLPVYFEDTKGFMNYQLRRRFDASTNPYEQAAVLESMAAYGWNFRYINQKASIADHPVIRTTGMRALGEICNKDDFEKFFGIGNRRVKKEIATYLENGIRNGDVGVIAEASIILRNGKMNFREVLDSLNFLNEALVKLQLPQDIEAYNELKRTIEFLDWKPKSKTSLTKQDHPIEWDVINELSQSTTAKITTSKGDIVMHFFPEEAPGSVANFIKLAKDGYFNGKNFHRVVPNFVVQGGCNRGDGYGAEDYAIRSEFRPRYYDQAGMVGMASAGMHTEGTQFFITHSATPHLDGRYTIFAEVESGLDVVHKIGIGDIIQSVTIN